MHGVHERIGVLCQTEREPTLYELVFCLLENAMNVLTRGYVYRRSKGFCVFRGCRDVLK